MTDLLRAGHWKHEWVPLDITAAKEKFHGRVPGGWHPPGEAKKTKTSHAPHGSDWMKLSNWRDSTDSHGYKTSDIGRVADFSATVHETSPSSYRKGQGHRNFDWRVFRQRTEREGPDARGSHWSGDYAHGTETDFHRAKSAAHKALKEHRGRHIAAGGDVGYGAESLKRAAMTEAEVMAAIRAAGMLTNPKGTERLHQYWVHGEGAAKVRWGQPGDFDRCVEHLRKYIRDPQGYCNLAHHAALGFYPATHAAMEHKAGRSAVTTPAGAYDADGLDESWDGDCSDLPDLTGLDVSHFEAAEKAMGMTTGPGEQAVSRAMPKLGTGKRFAKLKSSLAAKGAHDPGALAAYIGRRKFGRAKFAKLASKARGPAHASRAELFRSYPLEDYHIVRTGEGDSTGRVVEAYMTVFGEPAEIHDHQGDYEEDIDRAAFNKRIADLERSRNGFASAKVFYNHGMTIHATPSDRYSMPVAVCEGIRAETRGPITRSRYLDTPLGNEVLEMWLSGAVTAQSFTGAIIRSDPQLRRGEKYRPRGGQLPHVRRLELGLKEYGPTPFPAYQGAELVGVRMSPLGTWQAAEDDSELDEALPPHEEAAPGEPPAPEGEHLARYHQHALYRLQSQEARERIGLTW